MQSPFLADEAPAIDQPQTVTAVFDEETLEELTGLIALGLKAKTEHKRQEAVYNDIRQQVCEILVKAGWDKLETEAGKAKTKTTYSGWIYSEATTALEKQLKLQQEIERKTGVARPTETKVSADLS